MKLEIFIPNLACLIDSSGCKILYGYETWTNMNKKIFKILENIQKDAITLTTSITESTPYQGLLYECGLMPMVYRIKLKRLQYLHKLINIKETRLTKQVYQEQKQLNLRNGWYYEIMNDLIELNIQYSEKQISDLSRKDWKKIVKSKIIKRIEQQVKNSDKTKIRFIKKAI